MSSNIALGASAASAASAASPWVPSQSRSACRWNVDQASGQLRTGCGALASLATSAAPPRACDVCGRTVVLPSGHRQNKYAAIKTVVDGITFDSRKEARRYRDLRTLEAAGVVTDLERQVSYPITAVNLQTGELTIVARYVADFRFRWVASGLVVIEDAKGVRTPTYRLKKKLVEAQYGISITES